MSLNPFLAAIAMLAIFLFAFWRGHSRTETARSRLQASIDKGKAQLLDGEIIVLSEGITELEREKIEREIEVYLRANRFSDSKHFRLYAKSGS